ncbi:MAG: 5-oxoprolinase subunit PxpA [Pseudomonadota bacterium]
MTIDLNADCGESFGPWTMGDDAAILKIVTSANIACGFHAGDPETMLATLRLAVEGGVQIGAHPGFDDKPGFGRRVIPLSAGEITRMVAYQIGAACAMAALAGGTVRHVKAHGALSNFASANREAADAVAAAVKAVDPGLTLLAVATTELERAGKDAGLKTAAEIFADRAYEPDGQLRSRKLPGAMVHDPATAAHNVTRMVSEGALFAHDGTRIETDIHSVCVHGDGPEAIAIARAVREALTAKGHTLAPFATPSAAP